MLPKPDDYPDEPVRVVKLDFPVGEIYEVAFWRRFNVIDLITMERWKKDPNKTNVEKTIMMIRRVTLLTAKELETLDAFDFSECEDVCVDFLARGRPKKSENSKSQPLPESSGSAPLK